MRLLLVYGHRIRSTGALQTSARSFPLHSNIFGNLRFFSAPLHALRRLMLLLFQSHSLGCLWTPSVVFGYLITCFYCIGSLQQLLLSAVFSYVCLHAAAFVLKTDDYLVPDFNDSVFHSGSVRLLSDGWIDDGTLTNRGSEGVSSVGGDEVTAAHEAIEIAV